MTKFDNPDNLSSLTTASIEGMTKCSRCNNYFAPDELINGYCWFCDEKNDERSKGGLDDNEYQEN